jgi:Family of unknown function (DUF6188)
MDEVAFLVGRAVVDVQDGRIIFERGDKPEPSLYADVGVVTFSSPTGETQVVDGRAGSADPLEIVGSVVVAASAGGGTLALTFADGSALRCEPDPEYEAWQVVGGHPQALVVCLPGDGELAVWDSSTPPISLEEANELFANRTKGDRPGPPGV